jgi:uncharacterized repeat protein (TIGR03803 family)
MPKLHSPITSSLDTPKTLVTLSAILLALVALAGQPLQAQTLTVLHTFTGPDGLFPYSGVTMDGAGNLYGTTYGGGSSQLGTVYELKVHGSGYLHDQLHAFTGGNDGEQPWGGVVFGPQGGLIGTTLAGGLQNAGTVFSLTPPFRICRSVVCPWTETLPGDFGALFLQPSYGEVAFDHAGNIYGTVAFGGQENYGAVYELSRSGSGWVEAILYSFGDPDAMYPAHNVILDSAGNLYGTTDEGGAYSLGTVFELEHSGSGWSKKILASFGQPGSGIGGYAVAGLIMDAAGNLYGGTTGDGAMASVFELSPTGQGWQLTALQTFSAPGNNNGPFGNLVLDGQGNLYGTTETLGAFGLGNIFKLTPSGGSWTYTDLYDFTNNGDGQYPTGDLIIDSEGNLYGTNIGDSTGHGVVWKLTP